MSKEIGEEHYKSSMDNQMATSDRLCKLLGVYHLIAF